LVFGGGEEREGAIFMKWKERMGCTGFMVMEIHEEAMINGI